MTALLDVQILHIRAGSHLALLFYGQVQSVDIGPVKPLALDADAITGLQFLDEGNDRTARHAHVIGQSFLTWKTVIIGPGVREQHGICEFCTDR